MKKQEFMKTLNDESITNVNILFNTNTKQGIFFLGMIFASNKNIQIDMNKVNKNSLLYNMINTWKNNGRKEILYNQDERDYNIVINDNYSFDECIEKLGKISHAKNISLYYDTNNMNIFFELGMVYYEMYNNKNIQFNMENLDFNFEKRNDIGNIIITDLYNLSQNNKKRVLIRES